MYDPEDGDAVHPDYLSCVSLLLFLPIVFHAWRQHIWVLFWTVSFMTAASLLFHFFGNGFANLSKSTIDFFDRFDLVTTVLVVSGGTAEVLVQRAVILISNMETARMDDDDQQLFASSYVSVTSIVSVVWSVGVSNFENRTTENDAFAWLLPAIVLATNTLSTFGIHVAMRCLGIDLPSPCALWLSVLGIVLLVAGSLAKTLPDWIDGACMQETSWLHALFHTLMAVSGWIMVIPGGMTYTTVKNT